MTSVTASLAEPHVLAHTKRQLFTKETEETYAVVDTQFATESWGSVDLDEQVRELLSPFNHLRVGTGYPDLVGVRHLDAELLAADSPGETPPLIAVEAKGYTRDGTADTHRGIVQAHDRLQEANAVYLAAPADSIDHADRSLARELNVGVLGVDRDGDVTAIEAPRAVGQRATGEAAAVRFQASTRGVADRSFGLNHPKNYLGYPLAVRHRDDTEALMTDHVVAAVDDARQGAAFLGLVEDSPRGVMLTPLGREVVRFALDRYDSLDAALRQFEDWKRSRGRFSELAPEWGVLVRRVVFDYPATRWLVDTIREMHEGGIEEPTLPRLVEKLHDDRPSLAVELFLKGDETVRRRALSEDGTLERSPLKEGRTYHSPTVFQLKAMLYHAGIVTDRGKEPSRLDPTEDVWALRQPLV